MNGNSDGMINPLTPKPNNENNGPFDENLVEAAPESVPVNFSKPVGQPQRAPISQPVFQQRPPMAPVHNSVQPIASIEDPIPPAPVKKKKSNLPLVLGIILLIVAVGCAVGLVLMTTVFKPGNGSNGSSNSENSSYSDNGANNSSNQTSGSATIDSCPGCVFAYSNTMNAIVYSPNYTSKQYKSLSPDEYKTDWRDVVEETGHNVFLGLVLDEDNRPNRAFACLKIEDSDPFCLEGLYSGEGGSSAIECSEVIKKNVDLVNNVFSINSEPNYETGITYQQVHGKSQAVVELESSSEKGTVTTYDEDWVLCTVNNYGTAGCSDYWAK